MVEVEQMLPAGERYEEALSRLKPKYRIFVERYLLHNNASRAAIESGYSKASARQQGYKMLRHAGVKAAIEAGLEELSERTWVTHAQVIQELSRVAFANMQDFVQVQPDGSAYVDLGEIDREEAAAIQELTSDVYMEGRGEEAREVKRTRIRLADKLKALELLGKHLGMYMERREVSGPDGGPIPMSTRVEGMSDEEINSLLEEGLAGDNE